MASPDSFVPITSRAPARAVSPAFKSLPKGERYRERWGSVSKGVKTAKQSWGGDISTALKSFVGQRRTPSGLAKRGPMTQSTGLGGNFQRPSRMIEVDRKNTRLNSSHLGISY